MGIDGGVSDLPGVTAVICSRDRPDLLRRALTSLLALDPPASELLVIDNAPSDEQTRILVTNEFPTVRYVRETAPGLNFARNRAVVESVNPVVAFIDDDAVADKGWAGAFAATFRDRPKVAASTGRVEPLSVETEAQRLFEANGGFSRGLKRINLPEEMGSPLHGRSAPPIAWAVSIGCGASLAVRRDAVLAIGGFDNALDMWPQAPGGGDLDILWRLLDAGHALEYQPEALAWHEHRRDMAGIARQLVSHQRGLLAFLSKSLRESKAGRRGAIAAFLIWRLIKPLTRVLKRLIGSDPLPVALLIRMCWNCWVGAFSYRAARREALRRASLS